VIAGAGAERVSPEVPSASSVTAGTKHCKLGATAHQLCANSRVLPAELHRNMALEAARNCGAGSGEEGRHCGGQGGTHSELKLRVFQEAGMEPVNLLFSRCLPLQGGGGHR
jgi:hypothetical protein